MSSTSQSEFDLPQPPENPGLYSRPNTQPPPQPHESTTTVHSTDHGDGRTHDGTGAGATTSDADVDPTSDEFALLGAEQPAPPVTAADVRAWAAANDGTATVPRRKTSAAATIRPLVGHLFPVATKVEFLMAAVGSLDIEQGTERDTAEVVAALRRAKAMLEACAALAVSGAEAAASLMSMGPDGDCGEFAVDGYAHDHDDELIAIWDLSTLNTCDLEPVSKSTDGISAGGEVPAKKAPLLGSITGVVELLVLAGMRRQGSDLYYRFLTDPTSNETAASESEFTYDDYGDIVDKPAAPAALPVPPMITIIKATITNELQKIAAARDRQPTCSASSNADGSTAVSPFVSKHEHGRDATVPVLSKYGPMLGAFDKMSRSLDVAPDFYPAFETDFLDWLKLRNYFCLATVCAGTGPGADTWLDYFAEARRRCQDVLERVEAAQKKLRIPSVATLPVALLRETNSLRHLLELQQQQEAEMAQLRRDAAAAAALASKSSPPPASGNSNSSAPRTPVTSPPLGPHGAAGSFGARPSPGKLQPDALSGGVVTPHRPSGGGGGAGVSSGRKSSRLASPLTEQSPYVQSPAYLLTRTPLHGVDRDLFLIARPTDRCPLRLPGEPMGLLNIRQSCFVNCFAQAFFAVPGFTSCVFKFPAPHDLKEARAGLVSASTSPSRAPRSSQPAGTSASLGLQRAPSTGSNSGVMSGGKESAVPPRQLQCERVVHRLQALFAYMRHSASSYANPTPLLDAVAALFPSFSDGGQHDPQEFCDAVMTAVVEAYVGLPVSLKERLSSEADHVRQSLCNPQTEGSQPPAPSLSMSDAVTARGLDWRGMCECALLHQPVMKPSAIPATGHTTNDGVDSSGRVGDAPAAPTATLMRGPCIIPAYFAANEEEAEPSPARGGGRGSAIRTLSLTPNKTPSPPPQPVAGDATTATVVSAEGAQQSTGAAKHVDPMATSALQDCAVSNAGAPATSPPISATSVSTMSEPPSSTKEAQVRDSEKGTKAAACSAVSPMNVGDVQNERPAHTAPSSSDDGDDAAASPSFVTRLEHSIADFFTDCCEAVAEDAMSEAPVGTVKAFLSQEHAPSTLMVHLPMRLAGVDAKTGLPLKSDAEVSLPEVLDMTAYCCPPVTPPAAKLSSLKPHDSCRSDGKPQLHPNSRPATPSANDLVPPSKNTDEENAAQSQGQQVAQAGEEFPQRVDDPRRTALVHMKATVAAATATASTCDAAYREAAAAADKLSHPRHAHTLSPSLAFGSTSGAGGQDQPSPSEIAAKAAFAAADAIRTAGDDARRTAVRGRAQVSAVQAALTTPSAPQYSNDHDPSSAGSSEPLLYDCASVIVHVGDTADTGHYVTFAKHWITAPSSTNQDGAGDGDSSTRQSDRQRRPQWFIFDDTVTREVSADDAMRSDFVRRNCYCVVYTKRPHFASSPADPQNRLDELPSERQQTGNVEDDGVSPLTTPATSHVVSPVAHPAVRQCPAAAAWAAAAAVAAPRHLSKIVEREDKRILDKAYKRTMQSE